MPPTRRNVIRKKKLPQAQGKNEGPGETSLTEMERNLLLSRILFDFRIRLLQMSLIRIIYYSGGSTWKTPVCFWTAKQLGPMEDWELVLCRSPITYDLH